MEVPIIRFTPYAWGKMSCLMAMAGGKESGAYGISGVEKDLLCIEDIAIPKQQVTGVMTEFDGDCIGEYYESMVVLGRKPEQFARIWLHTHPFSKGCPSPSQVDEDTFAESFKDCEWAVMIIFGKNMDTYCRIKGNISSFSLESDAYCCVDYSSTFKGLTSDDIKSLKEEYEKNVSVKKWPKKERKSKIRWPYIDEENENITNYLGY